jgi:hypothetical protein
MTDNVTLNVGTGGKVIAADDIGGLGILYQKVKLILGAAGVNDSEVSKANPIPTYRPSLVLTDRSGTTTTLNTAQTLMAANINRKGWWLRNNSANSLYLNDLGVTATVSNNSIEVKTGEYVRSENGGCTNTAISLIGATGIAAGQGFTSREW